MSHPHETWMDEPAGKARHSTGNRPVANYDREHYHARSIWETGETVGTPFSEQDRRNYEKWHQLMERQSEALDYPN